VAEPIERHSREQRSDHGGLKECNMATATTPSEAVQVPVGREQLAGDLVVPQAAQGLVIFAHGSGSGRHSPRNQAVARTLQTRGLATLLADLLTVEEEALDRVTAQLRFDIDLLSRRLIKLIDWSRQRPDLASLPCGLFGASTGAAAALIAAADRPHDIGAVVSRGGRPDLAGAALPRVAAPTLLLVGSLDSEVIELNEWAKVRMKCAVSLDIVPGASHLFEEPGTLDQVASRAGSWFGRHLLEGPADVKASADASTRRGRSVSP
jgi:dienelactone hydrolase